MTPSIERKYRFCGHEARCAYCGEVGDEVDHTVPRSHVLEHLRAYRAHWFPKVRSCGGCNVILGAKLFMRFSERKAHVARKLVKKERRYLSALAWDTEEFAELGKTLRSTVAVAARRGEISYRRIQFASFPVAEGIPEFLFEQRVEGAVDDE